MNKNTLINTTAGLLLTTICNTNALAEVKQPNDYDKYLQNKSFIEETAKSQVSTCIQIKSKVPDYNKIDISNLDNHLDNLIKYLSENNLELFNKINEAKDLMSFIKMLDFGKLNLENRDKTFFQCLKNILIQTNNKITNLIYPELNVLFQKLKTHYYYIYLAKVQEQREKERAMQEEQERKDRIIYKIGFDTFGDGPGLRLLIKLDKKHGGNGTLVALEVFLGLHEGSLKFGRIDHSYRSTFQIDIDNYKTLFDKGLKICKSFGIEIPNHLSYADMDIIAHIGHMYSRNDALLVKDLCQKPSEFTISNRLQGGCPEIGTDVMGRLRNWRKSQCITLQNLAKVRKVVYVPKTYPNPIEKQMTYSTAANQK